MISTKPLFFVFTCVKDGRDFVDKLFDSLLMQTKINFIHFVFEDGSSFPLAEKIEEYRNKINQLRTPYQLVYECNPTNIGLNRATQYCISRCICPFFIWIDCDNYVDINFFNELEKTYNKNRNALLLRTILYDADTLTNKYFNCGSINDALSRYQLGLLIRRKYYYSFFAVNYAKYCLINPNNVFLPDRCFYNDEQVLLLCLLNCAKTPFSTKSIGYFLDRKNQESNQFEMSMEEIRKHQIKLCSLVSDALSQKIKSIYLIKDLYFELSISYKSNFKESIKLINQIKDISKKNHIQLKNYSNSSLMKYRIKAFLWRIKQKWRN